MEYLHGQIMRRGVSIILNINTMKKATVLMLILALSISCLAIGRKKREKMNSWLNHSKHELIMKWGPAPRVSDDGDNGQILIYYSTQYYDGTTYYNYRMFYVHPDGTIYSWRTSRQTVPPQRINVSLY